MKRVLFAGIALLALAGTAAAADLPRRGVAVPAAAPIPVPVAYNWSGFYAGINGGWGFGNSSWAGGGFGTTGDFDVDGGLAGGTLGFNWQHGPAVFGVETDLAWSGIEGSTGVTCAGRCTTENSWLGTTRGRLGYAIDRWMPYVTGGVAYGDIEARAPGLRGTSDTNIGWTVGAGTEFALAGNWTAKGEYLYVDLGDLTCSAANCGGVGRTKVDFNAHILRAGLNYRF
ncbi:MAG TPA: outer membrane protein [Xanthobacteraceae bacterium]|nr:outer membrane protein [Xanthobacteraceae bacterium]